MIKVIEKLENKIDIISLKNEKIEVIVTNYGCTILKMLVADKKNQIQDVVLGYDSIEEYQQQDGYLGALVGRVANRIRNGQFQLNDQEYHLALNNGPNSLHGGIKGFSYQVFDYKIEEDQVIFHYLSQDGEEGYPGNLDFYATYRLVDDQLIIRYEATTDQDTLINITNHTYFNLSGTPKNIDEHQLMICADQIACIDQDGCTTGEIINVTDTPFDFRKKTVIKEQIYKNHEQLIIGKGYDHPFIFNQQENQVYLYCEETGLELIVSTTLPQAQVYSANYLDGRKGKKGMPLTERSGLCIETQNMPDSIHIEDDPTVILRKDERYEEVTSYRLRVNK